MLFQTILITLPIFLIIALGWIFRKFKIVDDGFIKALNLFAYYVSLPALIISGFWAANFASGEALRTLLISFGLSAGFSLIVFVILSLLKLKRKTKAAIFLVSTVGNTVYMGTPLLSFAFGDEIAARGIVASAALLVLPILISVFAIKFWHDKEFRLRDQLLDFLKNPLFISFLIGMILGITNFSGLGSITIKRTLSMLGATASPVALFALGAFLYGKFLKKNLFAVFASSFVKVIAFPIIAFLFAGNLFGTDSGIYALLLTMPVAVTTFVIAEKYELDKDLVANSIFVSVVISFFVIPLTILLFK